MGPASAPSSELFFGKKPANIHYETFIMNITHPALFPNHHFFPTTIFSIAQRRLSLEWSLVEWRAQDGLRPVGCGARGTIGGYACNSSLGLWALDDGEQERTRPMLSGRAPRAMRLLDNSSKCGNPT